MGVTSGLRNIKLGGSPERRANRLSIVDSGALKKHVAFARNTPRVSGTRILEKRNSLQMSQVFPFPYIGNQMGLAFQGFYERDRRTGKVVGFPHLVHACTN